MSQSHIVTANLGNHSWTGKHGDFIDYYLEVEGYDEQVTLTQKPETSVPVVGQEIYGTIAIINRKTREGEDFQVHKLTKEQVPDGHPGPPVSSGQSIGGNVSAPTVTPPTSPGDLANPPVQDERSRRIERLACMKVAAALKPGADRSEFFALVADLEAGMSRNLVTEGIASHNEPMDANADDLPF